MGKKDSTTWRLITDDSVSASFGLAADDTLARRVGGGQSQATLRLYTYRSHCALVGRFQNLASEVHLDYCRAHRIAVNRRPSGGGAILMGADQLGVALTMAGSGPAGFRPARALMETFSRGLLLGLRHLGVKAEFQSRNDLEVSGRKIAGLGIYRVAGGGLLFHASLLVDLDVPLMLRVLDTPFEKIQDKEIDTVAARTTTVRRETGRDISLEEARRTVAEGYATAFGVDMAAGDFTPDERRAIERLERDRYLSPDWIFQATAVADAAGSATVRTPAGLLEVRVALAGRTLKAVWITGDFFASERAIAGLEGSLRWHSAEPEAIRATVQESYARSDGALDGIPAPALTEAILSAAAQSMVVQRRSSLAPYGCFVSPGGAHG